MSDEERRKLNTLWLVSEGRFSVCNQGVNISILRGRETKRQKRERKKRTHLFKQFRESTCFIFARIRRERTMTCSHTKQETHSMGKRDCLFLFC